VRLVWRPRGADTDDERFQVFRIDKDKVREIEDCRTLSQATKLATRFAASSAA
jgi:hypothetical protein